MLDYSLNYTAANNLLCAPGTTCALTVRLPVIASAYAASGKVTACMRLDAPDAASLVASTVDIYTLSVTSQVRVRWCAAWGEFAAGHVSC